MLRVTSVFPLCVALFTLGCGNATSTRDATDAPDVAADVAPDVPPDVDTAGPELLLHVPSPDWREQVIYFVFTDRFDDGDPTNNDQGANEYDPTKTSHYSGGDLQGIIDQLDYIQGLGATAVWITPPVANMWWDPLAQFGGFHGYWARDFTKVDEHQGTLATYQALSDALHRRGMYLVQDIVTNHTGNFFAWTGPYDPENPATNFVLNTNAKPTPVPEQSPFDQNDLRDAGDRAAGIYHWTPAIADYNDPVQEKTWQLSDLDDLATENPVVREALRQTYGDWIRHVGVDGFRIDTAKFVELDFWNDFLHGTDPAAPGIHAVASATGRDGFLAFGEVFQTSEPMDDAGDRIVTSYLGTTQAPGLDAVLGFPLYEELSRVIGGGLPTRYLGYRLTRVTDPTLYRDPHLTPNFLDNHDVQRFLATATLPAFEQALVVLFTVPGIPVVFQGSEQGFGETRASMFAAGWMSGGSDHFDTTSALYQLIKSLSAARRSNKVLTHGDLSVVADNPSGPGVIAYRRTLADEPSEPSALVLINTAEEDVLVAGLPTGLPAGTQLDEVLALRIDATASVGRNGELLMVMPPRSVMVLFDKGEVVTPPSPTVTLTVDTPIDGQTFTADVVVTGTVSPASTSLRLVLDGYLGRALTITPAADGTWSATIPVSLMPYGNNPHTLVVYAPDAKEASPLMHFTTNTTFEGEVVTVPDPVGDDVGPTGTYTYPQDTTFAGGRSMDIEQLVIEAGPTTLRLRFTVGELSTVWNPSNGFDHVCFNVYFDVPGKDGMTMLPKVQATAPDGFAWDFMHFGAGWSNALYKTDGATGSEWGGAVPGRPTITTNAPTRTITFEYRASTFGLESWAGVKVYTTTWDFDGIDARYRPLSEAGGPWNMGGGAATDPYIMDDVGPVVIPAPE
jgi:glycosidase